MLKRGDAAGIYRLTIPVIHGAGDIRPGPLFPGKQHGVTRRDLGHTLACFQNRAAALMAKTMRQKTILAAVAPSLLNNCVTKAAKGNFDQNLAGLECRNVKIDELKRLASGDQNGRGCLH